jgi:hypothetical protein
MFRAFFTKLKQLASALFPPEQARGQDPRFADGEIAGSAQDQAAAQARLDETSAAEVVATEVVATWSLLNPP